MRTISCQSINPSINLSINRPQQVNGPGRHPLYSALFQYEPELSGYPTRIAWVRTCLCHCRSMGRIIEVSRIALTDNPHIPNQQNFEKFLLGEKGKEGIGVDGWVLV